MGHANSTSLMSSPIAFRSSDSSSLNHSRTGSAAIQAVEICRQALKPRIHSSSYQF